jgi:hypothetical protein
MEAVQEQESLLKRVYDALNFNDHMDYKNPYGFDTLGQRWQDKTIGKEWREGQMSDIWDLIPEQWKPGVAEWGKGMAEQFGTAWMDARTLEGKEWLDPGKIAAAGTARTLEAIGIPFELLAQGVTQVTGLDIELSRIASDFIPVGAGISKLSKIARQSRLAKRVSQLQNLAPNELAYLQSQANKIKQITQPGGKWGFVEEATGIPSISGAEEAGLLMRVTQNLDLTPGGQGFYRPLRQESVEGAGKLYRQRTWKKLNDVKNLDDVPIQVQILDAIEELDDHIQRNIEIPEPGFDPKRPLKNYTGNRQRIFKYNDNGTIREIGLRWRNIRGKGFEREITDAGWQIYDHTKARARVAKRFAWNQVRPGSARIASRQVFESVQEAKRIGVTLLDSLAGSTNPADVDLYHRIVGGSGKWYVEHINPQNSAVWQRAGDGMFYHKFKQGVTPKHPSNLRLMGDEKFMKMKNSLEAMMDTIQAADGRLYRDAYWLDMDPQGNLLVRSMDTGDLVSSDRIWRNLSNTEARQQFKDIIAGQPTLPQPLVEIDESFRQFTKELPKDDAGWGDSYKIMNEINDEIKRLTNLLDKWIVRQSRRTNPIMKKRDQSIIDDYKLEIQKLENRKFDIKR